MDYVTYDNAGNLTGAYKQDLHPDHETNHIEVTQEQHAEWYLYRANATRDGVELAPVVAPVVTPIVPAAVTMRQARLALLQAGKLSAVNAAIASMQGVQGEAARIEWEFSNEVRRDQALVVQLVPVLDMTPAQIDQLFITAASL